MLAGYKYLDHGEICALVSQYPTVDEDTCGK